MELAAIELVDLIRDQVKKLEGQGHTNEITKIFGAIGQQTQISEFTGTDAPLILESRRRVVQRSTLTGLFLASLGLRLGNSVMSSITCVLSLILSIPRMIGAHSILSSLFAVSLCINIIISSTTTSDWWKEQKAGEFMTRIGVGPNFSMSKAIYFRDLNDVIDREIGEFEIPGNTW